MHNEEKQLKIEGMKGISEYKLKQEPEFFQRSTYFIFGSCLDECRRNFVTELNISKMKITYVGAPNSFILH